MGYTHYLKLKYDDYEKEVIGHPQYKRVVDLMEKVALHEVDDIKRSRYFDNDVFLDEFDEKVWPKSSLYRELLILDDLADDVYDDVKESAFSKYIDSMEKAHVRKGYDFIAFDGFERMVFPPDSGEKFTFCKTARQPFDTAVVACYTIAATLMPTVIEMSSDGDDEELAEGRALAKKIMEEEEEGQGQTKRQKVQ